MGYKLLSKAVHDKYIYLFISVCVSYVRSIDISIIVVVIYLGKPTLAEAQKFGAPCKNWSLK